MSNKHLAQLIDRQQQKTNRRLTLKIVEVNMLLRDIHLMLATKINQEDYKLATQYVDQYISYTSIWNLKFVYNLENPEVALLQMHHLIYILSKEPEQSLIKEREAFEHAKTMFLNATPFNNEQIKTRYNNMLTYIQNNEAK